LQHKGDEVKGGGPPPIEDLPLMEAIRKFLLDLPKNKKFEGTTINLNVGQISASP